MTRASVLKTAGLPGGQHSAEIAAGREQLRHMVTRLATPRRNSCYWRPKLRSWPTGSGPKRTGGDTRSAHPLERLYAELKRRSKVVGVFRHPAVVERLLGAGLQSKTRSDRTRTGVTSG